MTPALTVSVVIVSRDRPDALRRCLLGVSQLRYHPFEIVVVTDAAGRAALRGLPQAAPARLVRFDAPNISAARNAGISAAAGAVIAFIDDDAVPEPTWLTHLLAPFADSQVMAAGGFVRGRNGISWQSRGAAVDGTGRETPLDLDPERATVLTAAPGRAIKTEGTNMAVRRRCLAELGGFDPRYRFFLDETDLNLRLAERGAATALVPLAQVHHGFAASPRRRADRVPLDLREIGASWAVFLSRHCPAERIGAVWVRVQQNERRRALRHMVGGALEPRDVGRLLRGLRAGYAEGLARAPGQMPPLPDPAEPFCPYPARLSAPARLIAGRAWSRRRLRHRALRAVAAGDNVTVFRFSPTALFHWLCYTPEGYWQQTGGVFGRSAREHRLVAPWSFSARVRAEAGRVEKVRKFDALTSRKPLKD